MKFIYLAHPFITNPTYNIQRINKIAKQIVEKQFEAFGNVEHVPFVSHNILSVFSEENNCKIRLVMEEISQKMVCFCDELWICAGTISKGMALEIETAKQKKIPVITYEAVLEEFDVFEMREL